MFPGPKGGGSLYHRAKLPSQTRAPLCCLPPTQVRKGPSMCGSRGGGEDVQRHLLQESSYPQAGASLTSTAPTPCCGGQVPMTEDRAAPQRLRLLVGPGAGPGAPEALLLLGQEPSLMRLGEGHSCTHTPPTPADLRPAGRSHAAHTVVNLYTGQCPAHPPQAPDTGLGKLSTPKSQTQHPVSSTGQGPQQGRPQRWPWILRYHSTVSAGAGSSRRRHTSTHQQHRVSGQPHVTAAAQAHTWAHGDRCCRLRR